MINRPLRYRRDEDRSNTAACENERKGKASAPAEPRQHSARVRKLRSTIRDQSQNEERQIELRDVRPKSAERSKSQRKDQNRGKDNTPGRETIEQNADAWRNQGNGDGG